MFIILILAFISFFYEFFLLGKGLFIGDNLLVTIPHKIFIWESLKNGVLPLWNPHMWTGFPEMSDISIGLFDPFNALYFLFPGLRGINLVFLLTVFFALLGTYFLLKNEGIKKQFALCGSFIFAFSGSMLNMSADIPRLESICFLPWIILCFRKQKWLLTIVLLSLNFLTGRTQQFYMSVFFIICYLIFYFRVGVRKKNILIFFFILISSVGLFAFALLPQLELLRESPRLSAGLDYNTVWSLHPASFVRFFFADFWGIHNEGSFWGPDVTYSFGYIGFFALIFILLNLKKIRRKWLFFLCFAIFSLTAALGKYTPFYRLFLGIPGFSFFRNPSSWLILYSFSLAYLVAAVLNDVDFKSLRVFSKFCLYIGLILFFTGVFTLLSAKFYPELPNQVFQFIANIFHKNLSAFHNFQVDRQIAFLVGGNLAILGFMAIFLRLKFTARTFIFITFFDLLIFAKNDVVTAKITNDPMLNIAGNSAIKFLRKNLGTNRFVSTSEFVPVRGMSIYMTDYSRRPPFVDKNFWSLTEDEIISHKKYEKQIQLLPPNVFLAVNLSSINGYSGFYLKNFADYFSTPSENLSSSAKRVMKIRGLNQDVVDPSHVNFNYINFDDERLSNLPVKYILADEQLKLQNYKEIKFPNDFFIYENLKLKPRAEVFSQEQIGSSTPKIIDVNVNEVRVILSSSKFSLGDYVLLKDANYPGWQAYDQNGKKLQLDPKETFRKVNLNTDTKEVVFKFEPLSFNRGLIISFATLAGLLIFFVIRKKSRLFKIHDPI